MRPRFSYIVSPIGGEYNNTKKIGGVDVVVNTTIEDAKFVNRLGVVMAVPENDTENIKVGDKVIVHHNVFRTYLNMKGKKTKSNEFFRDDMYLVNPERIFLYKSNEKWKTINKFCFVAPKAYEQDSKLLSTKKEEDHVGSLIYYDSELKSEGLSKDSLVAFTKNSEYEFEIDGKKLYRMRNNDICAIIQ